MSSIQSTNAVSNAVNSDYNSLIGSLGSSSDFGAVFSQAMSAATTPAQKAQVEFDETQFSDLNAMASMGDSSSDSSSSLSSLAGLASLLGNNGSSSTIPAWETELANLLGPTSAAAQALNIDQQASIASQSLLNGDLNSLGSSLDSLS